MPPPVSTTDAVAAPVLQGSAALSASAVPSASAAPSSAKAAGEGSTAALFRKEITQNSARWLDCLDLTTGVVVARKLDCEMTEQNYVDDFRRICGPAARNVLGPVFWRMRARAQAAAEHAEERGQPFTCARWGRYLRCEVPPSNECESAFYVVFDETAGACRIRAVIERDDWQAEPEYKARVDARIENTMNQASPCPRY